MPDNRFSLESAARTSGIFEEQLATEILASERMRSTVLAALFSSVGIVFATLFFFFRSEYARVFGGRTPFGLIVGFLTIIILYEVLVRFMIGRFIVTHRKIPEPLRYANAFLETSTPTLLMIILSTAMNPVYTLVGPPSLAYFIFIILSALRLDFKLCAFTGFVAAAEYITWAFVNLDSGANALPGNAVGTHVMYLGKGIFMMLGGIAAGVVTTQTKRRVLRTFKIIDERNKIVSAFGQQVSPAIADELLKQGTEMVSQKRRVCIMFLDIRGFTRFAENRKPEEIVAYQNAVFNLMIDVVFRNHGIINQFLGDGFMATFGAPVAIGNDCENAVAAALEIIARVQRECEEGGIPPTRVGIGLHAGEAVTGNVGSSLRKQYSITGNVVILASRIEQLNKEYNSQLLISEEVWNASGKRNGNAVSLGPVTVKGREEPIAVFKLV
jgi:adenylate cyclase